MRLFSKSSKIAPEPVPPKEVVLELNIYDDTHEIWKLFSEEVKASRKGGIGENENEAENDIAIDYDVPGKLAYELSSLCEREGAIDLTAEKIMNFSQVTNNLLLLKKEGKPIGFLMLSLYEGSSQPKIWLVCVSSSEKGKQYSRILIDYAKKMATDLGKTNIHLEAISRTVGRKVYKPQGFNFDDSDGENMTAELTRNRPRKRKTRRNRKARKSTRRN